MKCSERILSCIMILPGLSAQTAEFTITEDGTARCVVVVAEDAALPHRHAAEELVRYLKEITGAEIPLVHEAKGEGSHLLVGAAAAKHVAPDFTTGDLGMEGLVIRTVGDDLILAGGEPRGTLYAVYTFLEEVLGCRWYTPHAKFIPSASTLKVERLDIAQHPSFEYRGVFYTSALDPDWSARHKCNGHYHKLEERHGGRVAYGSWCHTFSSLMPDAEYLESNPEYFSLIAGKRISSGQLSGQICLTNPEALKIVTDKVLEKVRQHPGIGFWSVSQNDNDHGYCRCENCTAVAEEEGSQSGPILRFVNAVADEVAKENPDVLIDTLAYQYSLDPPRMVRPRPNVRVRLCSISCCQMHPYTECDHPRNVRFMKALNGWSEITDQLYIWHYTVNFSHFPMPMPNFDELIADIPMYKRIGVKGIFMQGGANDRYLGKHGSGFMFELKAYFIAKMIWNADRDPRAVIEEFLNGYYGAAGKPIGEFLDLLHTKVREENAHAMLCETPDWAYLSGDLLPWSDRLFDEAEGLVADDPEILARVKNARLSLEYVQVLRAVRESLGLDPLPAQMTTPDYVRAMVEEPPADPEARAAAKAEALAWLEDHIERCAASGITHFGEVPYDVNSYFNALAAKLRAPSPVGAID